MDHPGAALSGYLDDALAAAERRQVEGHLASCDLCRGQLAALRATTRLIAALPAARPNRSLVPKLTIIPAWVRPARSLAAMSSGLFVLAFIASLALSNGLGGGGKGSLMIGAPVATRDVAPEAASAYLATAPVDARTGTSDRAAQDDASSAAGAPATLAGAPSPSPLGSPLVWLALAFAAALVGFLAHRRANPAS